jgi:hypothetical protein
MEIRGQIHAPAILSPRGGGKWVPNEQEAQWALEPVWVVWRRGTCLVPHRIRTLDLPARSLVSIWSQLRQFPRNRKVNYRLDTRSRNAAQFNSDMYATRDRGQYVTPQTVLL